MTNIDKIRQEIERQRSFIEGLFTEGDNSFYDGQDDAYNHLLAFIDSLPEEKPSEDLEEAAKEYAYQGIPEEMKSQLKPIGDEIIKNFKAGAEWQKEQTMKEAVDYKIVNNLAAYPVIYYEVDHLGLKYGDKVKLIIVKQ